MKAVEIPFVAHVGIKERAGDALQLSLRSEVSNHVGTMHAAALFALAETQSGLFLQGLFPEYNMDGVMPLLRGSTLKYRSPATSTVYAKASVAPEDREKFLSQFERKGRAGITVSVVLTDAKETIVMTATFGWFVQQR